jgi:hypothetical protein
MNFYFFMFFLIKLNAKKHLFNGWSFVIFHHNNIILYIFLTILDYMCLVSLYMFSSTMHTKKRGLFLKTEINHLELNIFFHCFLFEYNKL